MPRDWKVRIEDILNSIKRIKRATTDLDFDDFQKNEVVIDAVLHNLYVLGEAAARLPEEIRDKHPHVAWTRLRGMRNILSHEYFAIDITVVWQAATEDAPALKTAMEEILRNFTADPPE